MQRSQKIKLVLYLYQLCSCLFIIDQFLDIQQKIFSFIKTLKLTHSQKQLMSEYKQEFRQSFKQITQQFDNLINKVDNVKSRLSQYGCPWLKEQFRQILLQKISRFAKCQPQQNQVIQDQEQQEEKQDDQGQPINLQINGDLYDSHNLNPDESQSLNQTGQTNNFIQPSLEDVTGTNIVIGLEPSFLNVEKSGGRLEQESKNQQNQQQATPNLALKLKSHRLIQKIINNQIPKQNPQTTSAKKVKPQKCAIHKRQYLYFCEQQKKDLCNSCIYSQQSNHHNHKIICKCSYLNLPIKFKVQITKIMQNQEQYNQQNEQQNHIEQNDGQQYFCQSCIKTVNSQKKQICKIHYIPISKVCINSQCKCSIINSFLFCEKCDHYNDNGFDHQIIEFTSQQLMLQFAIKYQRNLDLFQSLIGQLSEKLQFNQLKKLQHLKHQNQWKQKILLDSIKKYNKDSVRKVISQFMTNKNRECIVFLNGIKMNNQKLSKELDVKMFLQFVNDEVQKIHQFIIQQNRNIFTQASHKLKKIFATNMEEIQQYIRDKYEIIKNQEIEDQFQMSPFKIQDYFPIEFQDFVKKIVILKYNQENQKIKRENIIKLMLYKFKNEFIFNLSKNEENSLQNSELIAKIRYLNHNNIEKAINQLEIDQNLKELITKQYQKITSLQSRQLKSCQLLQTLNTYCFSHLRHMSLIYKQQQYLHDYKSSIDATQLFKFISQCPALQQIIVKGLIIEQLHTFFMRFKNCILERKDTVVKKERILYQWMKSLKSSVKMNLSGEIQFLLGKRFQDKVQEFLFFFKQIGPIHNLKIIFDFKDFRITQKNQQSLKKLLNGIQKMQQKRIKILEYRFQPDQISYFFQKLAAYSLINELELINMFFQQSKLQDQPQVKQYLIKICSRVVSFYLHNCQLSFIPQFIDTQAIDLQNPKDDFIRKVFTLRPLKKLKLKQVQDKLPTSKPYQQQQQSFCQQHPLPQQHSYEPLSLKELIHVNYLEIRKCNWLDNRLIQTIQRSTCVSLKHLILQNQHQLTLELEPVFKYLENITLLELEKISFHGYSLLCIPSKDLQNLTLCNCGIITKSFLTGIDRKWSELRYLTIRQDGINQQCNLFIKCQFKGMITLKVSQKLIGLDPQKDYKFKSGIKITTFT